MTDVNPWADPNVKAKINQQGLGPKGAPRAESRRLGTLPRPVTFESKEAKIYGLQYDASVLGLPTLHLLRKGELDLVLAHGDVERLAGSGLTFDNDKHQFFVDGKPVLMDGTTFPINWIIKANGRIPQAFVRLADTKLNPVPPMLNSPMEAGDYDWREDHNVYPFDTQEYPMTDDFATPAAMQAAEAMLEPKSFFADGERTKKFFGDIVPILKTAGIEAKEQTDFMRAALGVASRLDFKQDEAKAKELILAAIAKRNKPPQTQKDNILKEHPVSAPVKTASANNSKGYVAPTTPDEILSKYMVNLKGKWYLQVPGRVLMFRLAKPRGRIVTELLNATDEAVVFKASIYDEDDRLLATGHARATFAKSENFSGRVFEKAETAAIGRALAHAGFGTDQAGDDMDEVSEEYGPAHLADSPR